MHIRNKHTDRYDLQALSKVHLPLKEFVFVNQYDSETVDFSNPIAVKELNRALLFKYYGIKYWDIPKGFLCPPIPGRADYIHYLADLLAEENDGEIPTGDQIKVLDIGVGANCIYPIIGHTTYGWHFVGTDTNKKAIESAKKIVQNNKSLQGNIQLRYQQADKFIFKGMINQGEYYHLTICNPPFHASAEEANKGSQRKWKNLKGEKQKQAQLNFGGQNDELWCEGGEIAFIKQMIQESKLYSKQCGWFTTLVSKKDNLPKVIRALKKIKPKEMRVVEMTQGNKVSRFLAWKF